MARNATDYYSILGVSKNANSKQISKAYKKLALQYHPDRNIDNNSEFNQGKFHEILTAYDILKDKHKRAIYDKYGIDGLQCNGLMPTNIDDLFDVIFSNKNNKNDEENDEEKNNKFVICTEVVVSLDELYHGSEKNINFKYTIECSKCEGKKIKSRKKKVYCNVCEGSGHITGFQRKIPSYHGGYQHVHYNSFQKLCNKCNGTGEMIIWDNINCNACNGIGRIDRNINNYLININKGIENGDIIYVKYKDEFVTGYLSINIKCRRSNKYYIKSADLYMIEPVEISLYNALCGGDFIIDHFGDKLIVECNWDIIECNEYHKIKKQGMLRKGTENSFGDLFVKFDILIPGNLEKETIQQICHLLNADNTQRIEEHSIYSQPVMLHESDDIDNSISMEQDYDENEEEYVNNDQCKQM